MFLPDLYDLQEFPRFLFWTPQVRLALLLVTGVLLAWTAVAPLFAIQGPAHQVRGSAPHMNTAQGNWQCTSTTVILIPEFEVQQKFKFVLFCLKTYESPSENLCNASTGGCRSFDEVRLTVLVWYVAAGSSCVTSGDSCSSSIDCCGDLTCSSGKCSSGSFAADSVVQHLLVGYKISVYPKLGSAGKRGNIIWFIFWMTVCMFLLLQNCKTNKYYKPGLHSLDVTAECVNVGAGCTSSFDCCGSLLCSAASKCFGELQTELNYPVWEPSWMVKACTHWNWLIISVYCSISTSPLCIKTRGIIPNIAASF